MKPKFISFPENVSQMLDEGTHSRYNCTVASRNGTKVEWIFGGVPIPECNHNNSRFVLSHNYTCLLENQPCVIRNVTVAEELFLVHSLILHLCSASTNHSGQYTCEVQGIDEEVVKYNNLITQQSIEVFIHAGSNIGVDTNVDEGSNSMIILLIVASVSMLIFIMLICVIIIMVKLFCYVKNPSSTEETGDSNQEMELTTTSPTKKIIDEDDWEFPREKLKLFQKIGKTVNQIYA